MYFKCTVKDKALRDFWTVDILSLKSDIHWHCIKHHFVPRRQNSLNQKYKTVGSLYVSSRCLIYEAREMYEGKYRSCAVKTQNLPYVLLPLRINYVSACVFLTFKC